MYAIEERYDSREFGKDYEVRRYTVWTEFNPEILEPEPDEGQVETVLLAAAPNKVKGWGRESYDVKRIGGNSFEGVIKWAKGEPGEDTITISFDTGGGPEKLYQALATTARYVTDGGEIQADTGAIGYDGEKVNGVDIIVPKFSWKLSAKIQAEDITLDYARTVMELTGTVNDANFHGFHRGELLLESVSGTVSIPATNEGELTFSFLGSPNKTDIVLGDSMSHQIVVAEKLGWEYLDITYKDDITGNYVTKLPRQVNVRKVYEFGDYSRLLIGG